MGIWDGDDEWFAILVKNAVTIPRPAVDRLALIAQRTPRHEHATLQGRSGGLPEPFEGMAELWFGSLELMGSAHFATSNRTFDAEHRAALRPNPAHPVISDRSTGWGPRRPHRCLRFVCCEDPGGV